MSRPHVHRPSHAAAGLLALTLCVSSASGAPAARVGSPGPHPRLGTRSTAVQPITHVVVIVQENRSVDNLFQKLPGARTQSWGYNSQGKKVALQPLGLSTTWDPSHNHLPNATYSGGFVTEYANGASDGWDHETFACKLPSECDGATAFAYVRPSHVKNYYDLATTYAFSDMTFQVNEGPSFPAHQYLIAGQAGGLFDTVHHYGEAENPAGLEGSGKTGGCDRDGFGIAVVDVLDAYPGTEPTSIFPCEDYQTVFDTFDQTYPPPHGTFNWRYYAAEEESIWDAPIGVKHLYAKYIHQGGENGRGNFSIDPGGRKFASDVAHGTLPALTYVVPCAAWSDHPGSTGGQGPFWVSFLTNTIGASSYWSNTAIIVLWDDWGGWYDHVVPGHTPNPYHNPNDPIEYGYRVPLMVVSPYARHGFIDHTAQTQMAVLTFIEHTFSLPSLQASDKLEYSGSDLSQMFDFTQHVKPYKPEHVPVGLFPAKGCPKGGLDPDE